MGHDEMGDVAETPIRLKKPEKTMEGLRDSVLPAVVALQDARWDFAGAPRFAASILRVRPIVSGAQLSVAADLAVSYAVAMGGATARNVLLSEPLALVATAQTFLPVFLAVWLVAVSAPSLLLFLPTRLAINSLNALSRIRSVAGAVAAASAALGPANVLGIALVGIAQASGQSVAVMILRRLLGLPALPSDTATFGFPVASAVAAGAGLALTHGTQYHSLALAVFTAWFVAQTIQATLATVFAAPAAPPASNGGKKKAKKDKAE
jgi:hypothetical protein